MTDEILNAQRAWLVQIKKEFDYICYLYKLKLRIPIFKILSASKRWGEWNPETRTIGISSLLIEKYSWDKVLEVLKHEIAHQYVSEVFKVDEGHGVYFAKACSVLGVSAWACKAQVDMEDESLLGNDCLSGEEERIQNRIQKLLALSSSTNVHEATQAMNKVHELQMKYALDVSVQTSNQFVSEVVSLNRSKLQRYHHDLVLLLTDYFFVEAINFHIFNAKEGKTFSAFEFMGKPHHVAIAVYVHDFLIRELDYLWRNEKKKDGSLSSRGRNAFYLGVLKGFREKLKSSAAEVRADAKVKSSVSLTTTYQQQLNEYFDYRYPKRRNISMKRIRLDGHAFESGKRRGRELTIYKPIKNTGSPLRLMK